MEAVKINLTGEMKEHYDIYYQAHVQNIGWLDWAKNGEAAGSEGYGYQMEALRIKLVKKGEKAPGSVKVAFKKNKKDQYEDLNFRSSKNCQGVGNGKDGWVWVFYSKFNFNCCILSFLLL